MRISTGLIYSGIILITLGIVLPIAGVGLPLFATIIIDSEPPSIVSSVPADGETYMSLTTISIRLTDAVSGVQTVSATIEKMDEDTGTFIPVFSGSLTKTSGTIYDGAWSASISDFGAGVYRFVFQVSDYAGNSRSITGTYDIYVALTGDWYINGIRITSPDQVIYLKTTTIRFAFVKTGGTAPVSQISVKVVYSGASSGSFNVPYDDVARHWVVEKTFPQGRYSMDLIASDGIKIIKLSIFDINIMEQKTDWMEIIKTYLNTVTLIGMILLSAGLLKRQHEL